MLKTVMRAVFFVLLALILWLALTPQPPNLPFDDEALRHATAFFVLPIAAHLAFPRLSLVLGWLIFAMFGGAIELMQLMMANGRQAQWSDWLVDLAALTVAICLLAAVRMLRWVFMRYWAASKG